MQEIANKEVVFLYKYLREKTGHHLTQKQKYLITYHHTSPLSVINL